MCPLYELSSFNPSLFINYDAMHTLGGIIKDCVVWNMQGLRDPNALVNTLDSANHPGAAGLAKGNYGFGSSFGNAMYSSYNRRFSILMPPQLMDLH